MAMSDCINKKQIGLFTLITLLYLDSTKFT